MKVINFYYPTPLDTITDKNNDNLDVIVTLENNLQFCIVVTTPENLKWQIENSNMKYLPLGLPQIIVACLDDSIIKEAIINYVEEYDLFKKYYID